MKGKRPPVTERTVADVVEAMIKNLEVRDSSEEAFLQDLLTAWNLRHMLFSTMKPF